MNTNVSRLRRGIDWLGDHQLFGIGLWIAVVGGVWLFVEIWEGVRDGESKSFDTWLLTLLHDSGGNPIGPGWVQELGRDFTALGGVGVLSLFALAVVGYLLLQSKVRAALLIVFSVGGGLLVSTSLKVLIGRPRPDLFEHASIVYTSSFPSGHSMMSAVVYLTMGALLARVQSGRAIKAYILLCAGALTLLVGLSRIYLGVHWPTDVLAGWTAGSTWALLCWLLAGYLQRSGKIESEDGPR